jgi:hypothetical protein
LTYYDGQGEGATRNAAFQTTRSNRERREMPEEIRPIRCVERRCGDNPCQNPATLEVLGPYPDLLCPEHAQEHAAEAIDERWDQPMFGGIDGYILMCEEAEEQMYEWEGQTDNELLREILEEARHVLLCREIPRARAHRERVASRR